MHRTRTHDSTWIAVCSAALRPIMKLRHCASLIQRGDFICLAPNSLTHWSPHWTRRRSLLQQERCRSSLQTLLGCTSLSCEVEGDRCPTWSPRAVVLGGQCCIFLHSRLAWLKAEGYRSHAHHAFGERELSVQVESTVNLTLATQCSSEQISCLLASFVDRKRWQQSIGQ